MSRPGNAAVEAHMSGDCNQFCPCCEWEDMQPEGDDE
jgi:hypothetical protein